MCSSNLQQTQVNDTGRYFTARLVLPFLNKGLILAWSLSLGSECVEMDWLNIQVRSSAV